MHRSLHGFRAPLMASAMLVLMAGCGGQVTYHGYVASEEALEQVQIGSSKEQVDIVMGTPSATSAIGGDAYYYVSETRETLLFFAPEVTDRRVLAVYFDPEGRVSRIANYGLQDGKVFDFITRTTVSSGAQLTFLRQLFSSAVNTNPFAR